MEKYEPYCFEEFKQYCEDNGIDYDVGKIKEGRGICYLENSDKFYPIYFYIKKGNEIIYKDTIENVEDIFGLKILNFLKKKYQ